MEKATTKSQQPVQHQNVKMSRMMMHQTDKEHEEQQEARLTSEVQHAEKSGL